MALELVVFFGTSYNCPQIKRRGIPWLRLTCKHTSSTVVDKQTFVPFRAKILGPLAASWGSQHPAETQSSSAIRLLQGLDLLRPI